MRTGGRPLTLAGLAQDGGGEGDLLAHAEGGLDQVQFDADLDAASAPDPFARSAPTGLTAAEEGVHDVVEGEAARAAEAAGPSPAARSEGVLTHVEHPTLVLVGEDLVGLGHLLEALLGRRVRVDVRVQLAREPPVRLLDLVLGRVATHPENLVIVSGH